MKQVSDVSETKHCRAKAHGPKPDLVTILLAAAVSGVVAWLLR